MLLSLPRDGGWHWCRPSVTGPDEHRPALIAGEALALNEFHLQILQRRLIQLELPLEGAIGQATPLAQECNRLIHHRHKVHPVASFSCTGPVCTCATS